MTLKHLVTAVTQGVNSMLLKMTLFNRSHISCSYSTVRSFGASVHRFWYDTIRYDRRD